jgi:hypothetical protein
MSNHTTHRAVAKAIIKHMEKQSRLAGVLEPICVSLLTPCLEAAKPTLEEQERRFERIRSYNPQGRPYDS